MPRNLQIILAYLLIFLVTIVKRMLRKNNKNISGKLISGKLISEYIFDLMLSLSLVFNNGILFIGSALVALLNVVINTYFTKQDNRELDIKSFVNLKVIIWFISILLSVTYLLRGDGYFGFNFISNADVIHEKYYIL